MTTADLRQLISTETNFPGNVAPAAGGNGLGIIIGKGFVAVLALAGLAALGYLLWAGYNWLTAGDDPKKAEEAQSKMTNAIIGVGIIAASLALGAVVNQFFQTGLSVDLGTGSGTSDPNGWQAACASNSGCVCAECSCGAVGFCEGMCMTGNFCQF